MNREVLWKTLRTAELLEAKLSVKLAQEQNDTSWLANFRNDGWRKELMKTLKEECSDNLIYRIWGGEVTDSNLERLQEVLDQCLEMLEKDEELSPSVKEAKKGTNAVTLGPSPELVDLIQSLAMISMPVALVLAARIKSITRKGLAFNKGIPPEVVDLIDKFKSKLPF